MLRIATAVTREQRPHVPIYFNRKNECAGCGGVGTLAFIDKFGKEARGEYRPFDHIECKRCGRRYSIIWKKVEDGIKMFPSAIDSTVAENFANMVNAIGEQHNLKIVD